MGDCLFQGFYTGHLGLDDREYLQ